MLLRGHLRDCVSEAIYAGQNEADIHALVVTIQRFSGR